MVKKFLLIVAVMAAFSGMAFSNTDAEVQRAMKELMLNQEMMHRTMMGIQANPDTTLQIMNQLKSDPELMRQFQAVNSDKEFQKAVLEQIKKNPSAVTDITVQIINDPALTKQLLLKMGKDAGYADELAKDAAYRKKLSDRVKNDPALMQEIYRNINIK